jgi:phosphate uptake regulator
MFVLKTARHLEIMGDLANNIANDVLNTTSTDLKALVEKIDIQESFTRSNRIIELTLQAFDDNNTSLAQVARNRIAVCQEMVAECIYSLAEYLKLHPHQHKDVLNLFSVFESLSRTLEVTESVSHGIIKYGEVASIQA